ncbi:uncharacterized protein EV422DRAFT_74670 [Fimicolochytrium jonesii]|uniref:uncharacterized protein n=1 Tax=Fimicolochytrium jonesii TaxID=1396493 RepID=UPI0022FE7679|nr:uncharacterized protein EV422DRAFT_74670 [Fimicolochytrium jonesii]KAI8820538.1 hypothetical protein EV422DRAFT_74670 [Fimicolochytrium jonesii]
MGTKDMTRVQSSSSCFRIRHPHYEGLFNQSKADIAQKLATLKQYGTAAEALDPLRVESLQNVFETTINEYTVTFAPLLREIKREYDLVIAAHISQKAEKAYLRTKIQTLLCEIGSEQQADDLRSTLVKQTLWNQLIEKENDRLRENLEEEDTQFLLRLAHKCVESPPGTQQSDRQRHLLRHKEGWSTVLKWMTEYSLHDVVLRELLEKIERDVS